MNPLKPKLIKFGKPAENINYTLTMMQIAMYSTSGLEVVPESQWFKPSYI